MLLQLLRLVFGTIESHSFRVSLLARMLGKGVTIQVPYIFKHLVDALPAATLTTTDPVTTVPLALLLGYGVARASSVGLHEWRNAIFAHVAQDAIRQVGRQVFDHVHRLDLSFHLSRNTGQVARILDRGQRSISMVLNAMVFHVLPTIFEVSLVTGLLAYQFGAAHSIVILGTISSYLAFTIAMTQWRTKFRRDMVRLENQASGQVVDSLMNYETVRYFNNQQHEGERYEKSLRGYQLAALDAQSSLSWLNFGQAVIFSTGLTAVMGLTAQQVLSGTATPGDLVLVNGLLFQLSVPLFFIGGVYREVRQALIDMEAMFQLRDTKPNIVDPTEAITYDASTMGTEMQLENVHFAYPTAANKRPILQGSNLTIPHGKTVVRIFDSLGAPNQASSLVCSSSNLTRRLIVLSIQAFVGASGCGKSTVLRLLYRFYDPDKGRLTIGGQDLRDLDQQSLQKSMAVVPQDTVLFHESIGYNIQYGNLDAPWEEVVDAAKKAHIHDTIMSFPDGYDTIVGERGLKLSGGEKQRVAIARAMLKDSPILLCDEPTSSLDSQTETEIMNNLKSIGKDRTTIIIAHRLSTIQDCDEIVVWSMGQVVEKGTHEELVRLGGRYTELLRMQETIPDS